MPLTAAGTAEHANEFRTWTVRVSPSTFFTDHPLHGLRALDHHTLQFKMDLPRPRLMQTLAYACHATGHWPAKYCS